VEEKSQVVEGAIGTFQSFSTLSHSACVRAGGVAKFPVPGRSTIAVQPSRLRCNKHSTTSVLFLGGAMSISRFHWRT